MKKPFFCLRAGRRRVCLLLALLLLAVCFAGVVRRPIDRADDAPVFADGASVSSAVPQSLYGLLGQALDA